jgi:hypothetical protein
MPVRKTETRIPLNLQPSDLGQAVVAPDGRCALVSFVTSPLVVNRENVCVVFITDVGLAALASSFEWTFVESGDPPKVETTQFGEMAFTARNLGTLNTEVRVLDASNAEQAKLSLVQDVVPPSAELEALIADSVNKPGAGMGNPEVLRELVNDHNPYYFNVSLKTPEAGEGFRKFLFSTINDGVLQRKAADRRYQLDQVTASLNTGEAEFVSATAPGLGVSAVRLSLAAMMLPPMSIPFTELPATNAENAVADEQLRQKLAAMSEPDRIDLFNLVRFPKSNINLCGKLLEALRDKYFSGVSFDDILTKMSGTIGDWIILNYNRGPLQRD